MSKDLESKVKKESHYELSFLRQIRQKLPDIIPQLEGQYKPFDGRKYAYDFAIPDLKILIDIQGGTWVNGRHNRAQGMNGDCEKNNLAQFDGYSTFIFTGDQVKNGSAIIMLERFLYHYHL